MPLLLYGCALQPVAPELQAPPHGRIAVRPGRPGVVVAALHSATDPATDDMAIEIARRTGFGLVVATGLALEPDRRERPGRGDEVHRPAEGMPGRPPAAEMPTTAARRVSEEYERRVQEAAQGPLTFYAEIHGNNRRDAAGQIEIATVAANPGYAERLRTLLELIRDAHLSGHPTVPRLDIRIEPADPVRFAATGARPHGILRLPERALHIELPRAARAQYRDAYTAILADFLAQVLILPSAP